MSEAEAMRAAAANIAKSLVSSGGVAFQIMNRILALPLPEAIPDPLLLDAERMEEVRLGDIEPEGRA